MFSLAELDAAAAEVHAVIPPTPQHRWALLSDRVGADVYVKHENHTPLGAFKCRGGVTYLNDMYFYPAAMARAAIDSGIRAGVSINVIDFPTGYAANADEYIARGLEAYEQFKGQPSLDWTSAPHAPYTVSDETFVQLRELAQKHGMKMHCHIHETQAEVDDSLKQYGIRPLERLDRLGLLNE